MIFDIKRYLCIPSVLRCIDRYYLRLEILLRERPCYQCSIIALFFIRLSFEFLFSCLHIDHIKIFIFSLKYDQSTSALRNTVRVRDDIHIRTFIVNIDIDDLFTLVTLCHIPQTAIVNSYFQF